MLPLTGRPWLVVFLLCGMLFSPSPDHLPPIFQVSVYMPIPWSFPDILKLKLGSHTLGFPRWLSGKETACQCRRFKRLRFNPWVGKILWRKKWQPIPVFLPGEPHGQRSLAGYSPWGGKELVTAEQLRTVQILVGYLF